MKKLSRVIITALVVLVLVSNIGQAQDIKVVDDLNREVTIKESPARIVSLAPNITEILYALGLEDKIVGVTNFCDYPLAAKDKPKVGTKNVESIIATSPDVVIAANIIPEEIINRLGELDIPVIGFDPKNIEETIATIGRIGEATGADKRAKLVMDRLESELKELKTKVAKAVTKKGRLKVFYEVWKEPLITAGANTFIDNLISAAGGRNIGREATGLWPQYSLEQLLIENPAVYIASSDSWKKSVIVDQIKKREIYQDIKAIKDDRIYIVDANIINRPGPRIIESLKMFIKSIHPEIQLEN